MKRLIAVWIALFMTMAACDGIVKTNPTTGQSEIRLECGQKVVSVFCERGVYGYTARPFRFTEIPETYTLVRDDGAGGTTRIQVVESSCPGTVNSVLSGITH